MGRYHKHGIDVILNKTDAREGQTKKNEIEKKGLVNMAKIQRIGM